MKRMTFATASAFVALAAAGIVTGVQAADLIVSEPAPMAPASPTNIYALLYGGIALGGTADLEWFDDGVPDGPYSEDLDPNWALGAAVGVGVADGLSIEADVFHTNGRVMYDDPDYNISTTSLMANLKYTAHLSDTFDVYAGAGIGGINLTYDYDGTDYSGWGLGYQVMVGASANVTDNIGIFGEVRYQNSFSAIETSESSSTWTNEIQAPVLAVLAGIKIGM